MPTVAFFLHPRALMTSITIPAEMIRAADGLDRARRRAVSNLEIKIATVDGRSVPAFERMSIEADCAFSDLGAVDLLFFPSFFRNPLPVVRECSEVLPALSELAAGQTMICSSGTGAFFPAEAGLLDGKPATTHWFYLDAFARRYPRVDLKRDHLITRAGNHYCAGSVNSLADLTTHFIERLYGPRMARHVAVQFSPESRRPYRSQGFIEGEVNPHRDEMIVDAQQWLSERLAEKVRISDLALELGVSPRTLHRRFREATGISPIDYHRDLRIALACELLAKTNFSIAQVGAEVGYDDNAYFATVFRAVMGQTPSMYRRAVRGKLFSVEEG